MRNKMRVFILSACLAALPRLAWAAPVHDASSTAPCVSNCLCYSASSKQTPMSKTTRESIRRISGICH